MTFRAREPGGPIRSIVCRHCSAQLPQKMLDQGVEFCRGSHMEQFLNPRPGFLDPAMEVSLPRMYDAL